MPSAPKHSCNIAGCSALIEAGDGLYCPAHKRRAGMDRAAYDAQRGTAHSRGYDANWQRERLAFLSRWPLCLGILIPDMFYWSRSAAVEFHTLREAQRERGPVVSFSPAIMAWLEKNPIYRLDDIDRQRPANVVDHIIPHKGDQELFWAEWNWQPLTKQAHDKKTAGEDGGWGNSRKKRVGQ